MLTEVPNEPTGFIKLISTMSGDGDEVTKPDDITRSITSRSFCYVVASAPMASGRPTRWSTSLLYAHQRCQRARNPEARGRLRLSVLDRQEHAGFAPVGPFILTMDEVADTDNLWSPADVNGQQALRSNTNDYLYKIADVLEHFSRHVVFEPGDLIAMGAPSGVAVGQPNAAELYLQPGRRHGDFVRGG